MRQQITKKALAFLMSVVMLLSTMGAIPATAETTTNHETAVTESVDTAETTSVSITSPGAIATDVTNVTDDVDASTSNEDEQLAVEPTGDSEEEYTTIKVWTDAPEPQDVIISVEELEALENSQQSSRYRAARAGYPSYKEVSASLEDMATVYPEGTPWTNFVPYGDGEGAIAPYYVFRGGPVKGAKYFLGCAAYIGIGQDTSFGDMPAYVYDNGTFTYDDIKVGDALRVNNSHFVIIKQKSAGGVIVTEANYGHNKSVHHGRSLSVAEVLAANFVITRYPKDYVDPDSEGADEIVQSGAVGSLEWTLTQAGTLTITGRGAIPDFDLQNRPDWETDGYPAVTSIHIDSGITSIGSYAFYHTTALDVMIANTVTSIGDSAFEGNLASSGWTSSIVAMTIPSSVQSIGNSAFRNCGSLTSVSISEGVKTIGDNAFRACTSLQYADFPSSVTNIGAGAFMSCEKMKQVRFKAGSGDVTMGDDMFAQCYNLMSVTLPKTLTAVSNGMFDSCKILSQLYIPVSVKQLGGEFGTAEYRSPFTSCGIKKIYFGGSEAEWKTMLNSTISGTFQQYGTVVEYNATYMDPFAADPDDPGDLIVDEPVEDPCKDGHTGTADENGNCTVCGKPIDNVTPPSEPTEPTEHAHQWAEAWSSDSTAHWHDCNAEGCEVTNNAEKDSYAEHSYGAWIVDTVATISTAGSKHRDCSVCAYRQTESIPATGSTSSGNTGGNTGGGSSSGNGSSGGSYIPPSSGSSGGGYVPPSNNNNSGTNPGGTSTTTPSVPEDKPSTDDPPTGDNNPDDTDSIVIPPTSPEPIVPDNVVEDNSSARIAKAKQQMNKNMKALVKSDLQIRLTRQLKANIKKQLQKPANKKLTKKQVKAKLKKQLKASLKAKLKPLIKAKLKTKLKKQYGATLGTEFASVFNQQFSAQFASQYTTLFNKYFNEQFAKLYKKIA